MVSLSSADLLATMHHYSPTWHSAGEQWRPAALVVKAASAGLCRLHDHKLERLWLLSIVSVGMQQRPVCTTLDSSVDLLATAVLQPHSHMSGGFCP